MKKYKLLGIEVHSIPEHTAKNLLINYLESDTQHQITTVNPEFIVSAQSNKDFFKVINESSLATIDGSGIIRALQYLGNNISLDERLTGVELSKILINTAIDNNYKILFCLNKLGLTHPEDLFMKIKEKYPSLDFQVADEETCIEKATIFKPEIALIGFGAPYQDLWIYENLPKISSVKIGVGIGGTLDFMSGAVKRAPKFLRSFGLEWIWRLIRQPLRLKRIFRAIIVFPYLVIKNKNK